MRFCLTESLTYDVYMQGNILRVVDPIYPNLARSGKDLKFDCLRLGSRPLDNYQFQTSGQDLAPSFAVRFAVRLVARLAVRLVARAVA